MTRPDERLPEKIDVTIGQYALQVLCQDPKEAAKACDALRAAIREALEEAYCKGYEAAITSVIKEPRISWGTIARKPIRPRPSRRRR